MDFGCRLDEGRRNRAEGILVFLSTPSRRPNTFETPTLKYSKCLLGIRISSDVLPNCDSFVNYSRIINNPWQRVSLFLLHVCEPSYYNFFDRKYFFFFQQILFSQREGDLTRGNVGRGKLKQNSIVYFWNRSSFIREEKNRVQCTRVNEIYLQSRAAWFSFEAAAKPVSFLEFPRAIGTVFIKPVRRARVFADTFAACVREKGGKQRREERGKKKEERWPWSCGRVERWNKSE